MFGFFGRKRERKPTPPWVAWLLIGVVIYAMIANQQKGSEVNQAVERTTENIDRQFSALGDVKDKIIPSFVATVRINDIKLGEGAPAVCGQEVTIIYDAWLNENTVLEKHDKDKPLTFTIGSNKVLPALERGVIGMQIGGRRSIIAPYDMTYGASGFNRDDVPQGSVVKFNGELLAVNPKLPDIDATSYRIIDTLPNTGSMIFCGMKARAHVTVWGTDGKKLFTTKEPGKAGIEFTPGASEVFLGLEQGIVGMAPRSQRMLIVPPSFQKTMNGNAPIIDFPFPKAQTVLVDIEALP